MSSVCILRHTRAVHFFPAPDRRRRSSRSTVVSVRPVNLGDPFILRCRSEPDLRRKSVCDQIRPDAALALQPSAFQEIVVMTAVRHIASIDFINIEFPLYFVVCP